MGKLFNWFSLVALLGLTLRSFAKESQITSPLAWAVCTQWADYKKTKVIPESLERLPTGYPLLTTCDNWLVNKCDTQESTNCGTIRHKECADRRVIGGSLAGHKEFPWDAAIRFIYDWGSFYPEPRPAEDVARNDFRGLKEVHRCTATIYSPLFVITSGWCGNRAKEYVHTRNRFVIWVSRGRFLDAKLIEALPGKRPKGEIYIHPEFNAEVSTNHNRDHDIAILKLPKPFKFASEVYGIEVAKEDKVFTGKATFTGWGTTSANTSDSMLGNPGQKSGFGNKLYKIELTLMPWAGVCETTVREYLEVDDNYDPNEDLSKRYLCAKADDNDEQAKGACGGDIGGPLICGEGDKKYLCGIRNSWAIVINCPSKDNLEIFIRPSYYSSWIEKVAGKQKPEDLQPPKQN